MIYGCYEHDDGLNLERRRNLNNTPRGNFNCGGYALGTFSWYMPATNEDFDFCFDPTEDVVERTECCVRHILEDFTGSIRRISGVDECADDEYVIAFRLEGNPATWQDDFHFMRRDSSGVWRQKLGGRPRIETVRKEIVFSSAWEALWLSYEGPIVLFAKKKIGA